MNDKFDNLRDATGNCIGGQGGSRNDDLFEFRNAATVLVIDELLREYDRLREKAAVPAAAHALGTLTSDEAKLLQIYRQADDRGKMTIEITAELARQVAEGYSSSERCEVIDITSARQPKG